MTGTMNDPTEDLQTAAIFLALKATPGSDIRRDLCGAAAMFPDIGPASDAMQVDPRGGLSREEVAGFLRRINTAREQGDDPTRSLRAMRNNIECALDYFDLPTE